MKLRHILPIAGFWCLAPGLLLAHAELKASTPASGAVVTAAPAAVELDFSEEVQLLKLAITGIDSKMIPTTFKPTAQAQTAFAVPLPALKPDAYVVKYTILGKDGHQVEDSITFIVKPAQ